VWQCRSGEFTVGEPLAEHASHHILKPDAVVAIAAVVVAEHLFVDVTEEYVVATPLQGSVSME